MPKRPRVLLAVTSDESLIFHDGFPQYLVSQGWDVHLVSAAGPRLAAFENLIGITAHALPMKRNPSPFADVRSFFAWWRLLGRVRPDVLIVGTPKASLLGLVAGRSRRIPTRVYHVLGLRLESASGAARVIYRALESLTASSATRVLSVSGSLADALAFNQIIERSKIDVLGAGSLSGVDTDRFSPQNRASLRPRMRAELELVDTDVLIGFVGRLNADKGLATLEEALFILMPEHPQIRVVIVGDVDVSNAANPGFLMSSAGVRVVGYADDPGPYYAAMDILCLPTRREGMPNVVLEASASGLPVVTTDATGAIDSVVDGVTGIVVAANDAAALAAALRHLVESPHERTRLGDAGRARMLSEFRRAEVWRRHDRYLRASLPAGRGQLKP